MRSAISRDVTSGALTAVVSLAYSLSCAALIFSGTLADGLPYGITAALVAMSVCALAVALLSPFTRAIAGPDGNAAAVLGAMAAAIAATMSRSDASQESILATVLCGLAIATAFTGLVLFALGALRAAQWVRFIPYPVMGGFIAAVGWLLVAGAVSVVSGIPLDFDHVALLLQPQTLVHVLVMVAFTCGILLATWRVPRAMGLTLALIVSVAVADVVFAAMPGGLRAAAIGGWFFYSNAGAPWTPWYLNHALSIVSWTAIAQRWAEVVTVALVSTITILVNATAFEVVSRDDINLNQELRADGVANLASAAAGGFTGNFSLSRSVLNLNLAGSGRLSGITVAILGAVALLGGARVIEAVPKFVLAGLLLYLGIAMLDQWVLKTRRRVAPLEYASLLAILVVNVWLGFLAGLIVGLVVGAMLFAFNYSRVAVISQHRSGIEFRSNLMRSSEELAVLAAHGNEIRVFMLQGFLFFGMAHRIYRNVRTQAIDVGAHFIILDFRGVVGLDAAAASSFVKIVRAAEHAGVEVVFTTMNDHVAKQWIAASEDIVQNVEHFSDLDHAMEWCENLLVARNEPQAADEMTLVGWLSEELGSDALGGRFTTYLAPRELERGEVLCTQGEPADSMFFIERGRVGIVLEQGNGKSYRLRSLSDHTMLGEMGLYRRGRRSASAIAERATMLHVLTYDSFRRLERSDPDLATAFHAAIVRALSDRLSYQNVQIAALT